jgi:hypothetical protein
LSELIGLFVDARGLRQPFEAARDQYFCEPAPAKARDRPPPFP